MSTSLVFDGPIALRYRRLRVEGQAALPVHKLPSVAELESAIAALHPAMRSGDQYNRSVLCAPNPHRARTLPGWWGAWWRCVSQTSGGRTGR